MSARAEAMRALVWEGPRKMMVREVPTGEPGPGEILLQVESVGICGSELSGYLGHNSLRKPPLIMGHEFSGTVVSLGERVEAPVPGERVVVNPLLHCGTCSACRRGRFNLCSTRALIGAHRPGAFAEMVVVPAVACLTIPADFDPAIASLAEPLACAVRAVRVAGVGLGDGLMVLGAGPIGLLCALLGRLAGTSVAITDTNPSRLAIAETWGFRQATDHEIGDHNNVDQGDQGDQAGFDSAIDAVGLEVTRRQAIGSVRRGGQVVFVGLHGPDASFDGNDVVRNEVSISGSFAYTPGDFEIACGLLARGVLPEDRSWLSVRPLEAGPESFLELVDGQPDVLKVVLQP